MKIADLHCDTISEIWKSRRAGRPQQLFQNNLHVDIQKMQKRLSSAKFCHVHRFGKNIRPIRGRVGTN